MKGRPRLYRPAFFLFLTLVTVSCLLPGSSHPDPGFHDKFVHAAAYFIMGGLGLASLHSPRRIFALLGFVIFWGVLVEIGQLFVPGRSFEWADMLANSVGAGLAFLVFRPSLRDSHEPTDR